MILECFLTLHMMRTSNGWSPNPITLREIKDYLDLFGRMPVDMDLLVRLIKVCDEAALAWFSKKTTEKSKERT